MQAYYGTTKKGNILVYIPYHLAGISLDGMNFRCRFDIDFLDKLDDDFGNKTIDDLNERGFVFEEVDIGEYYLRPFRRILYEGNTQQTILEANGLAEIVAGAAIQKSPGKFGVELYEDRDNWWEKGEEAPFLRDEYWKQE